MVLVMITSAPNSIHMNATGFFLFALFLAPCVPQVIIWYKKASLRKALAAIPDDKLPQIRVQTKA